MIYQNLNLCGRWLDSQCVVVGVPIFDEKSLSLSLGICQKDKKFIVLMICKYGTSLNSFIENSFFIFINRFKSHIMSKFLKILLLCHIVIGFIFHKNTIPKKIFLTIQYTSKKLSLIYCLIEVPVFFALSRP